MDTRIEVWHWPGLPPKLPPDVAGWARSSFGVKLGVDSVTAPVSSGRL